MAESARRLAMVLRSLRRQPGYAATVVLTLAVGIGASTSIFSILQGSVLRPLPFAEADRLIRVRDNYLPTGGGGGMSIPNYLDLRTGATTVEELVGFITGSVNLATQEAPLRAAPCR